MAEIDIPGYQPATAFNIDQFRATVNKRGVARNNYYTVEFTPPIQVGKNAGIDGNASVMQDILMYAESATLPGLQLATTEVRNQGVGPVQYRPYAPLFSRELTINFIVDASGIIPDLFYVWMRTAVNYTPQGYSIGSATTYNKASPFEVSYPAEYQTRIKIKVLDNLSQGVDRYNRPTVPPHIMTYTLYDAYPVSVMDMRVAYGAQDQYLVLPVAFNYYHWYCETFAASNEQPAQSTNINQGSSSDIRNGFNQNVTNRQDQTGIQTTTTRGNIGVT